MVVPAGLVRWVTLAEQEARRIVLKVRTALAVAVKVAAVAVVDQAVASAVVVKVAVVGVTEANMALLVGACQPPT